MSRRLPIPSALLITLATCLLACQGDPDPDAAPEMQAPAADAAAEPLPDAEPEPRPDADPGRQPDMDPHLDPDLDPAPDPDPEPDMGPDPDPVPGGEACPETGREGDPCPVENIECDYPKNECPCGDPHIYLLCTDGAWVEVAHESGCEYAADACNASACDVGPGGACDADDLDCWFQDGFDEDERVPRYRRWHCTDGALVATDETHIPLP